ncbi:hypothetical protein IR145_16885, partial [Streptococcus danieliae]|nr:hypothetical protein [Streptococcus danieliae]
LSGNILANTINQSDSTQTNHNEENIASFISNFVENIREMTIDNNPVEAKDAQASNSAVNQSADSKNSSNKTEGSSASAENNFQNLSQFELTKV